MIWRAANPDRNLNVFLLPMFTPLEDRNLINFSLGAGLPLQEPIDGRPSTHWRRAKSSPATGGRAAASALFAPGLDRLRGVYCGVNNPCTKAYATIGMAITT
jgi:hypothetical protein